jgi:hypothetical protein
MLLALCSHSLMLHMLNADNMCVLCFPLFRLFVGSLDRSFVSKSCYVPSFHERDTELCSFGSRRTFYPMAFLFGQWTLPSILHTSLEQDTSTSYPCITILILGITIPAQWACFLCLPMSEAELKGCYE